MAILAAILLVVAYRMSEWRVSSTSSARPGATRSSWSSRFCSPLLVDLTVGIGVGMVLASFLFMKRMAEVTNVTLVSQEFDESASGIEPTMAAPSIGAGIPPGVEVYEINGPFFFGAAEKFKDTLGEVSREARRC